MQEHFGMFNQFITKYVKFTEAELADLNEKCTKVYFSKGALIMKAGEIQNNLYFITKGIVRYYVENKESEIKVFNFRSEYMTVTGYAYYNYEDNLKALVLGLNMIFPAASTFVPALQFIASPPASPTP